MKKILIVTPRAPFQSRGADEQDRTSGIKWFLDRGFDVRVITKVMEGDRVHVEKARKELGVGIREVPYKFRGRKDLLKRIVNPAYWDGAAYEYFDPEIQEAVKSSVEEFSPDLVWFDYTYLWPLYRHPRKRRIPVITRSINFEPTHFLDEDGRNPLNYLRAIPKLVSEILSFRMSDHFFSITPKEEGIYRKLGSTKIDTLPLRSLPERIIERKGTPHEGIRIGFMPSTYTVAHNREALLLIMEAITLLSEEVRRMVSVHVTGQRFPENLKDRLPGGVVYEGFVPDSIEFWQSCDIALAPSVFGAGMQQKIFEPIALGVTTITSRRGIAGYPFECGREILCADSKFEIAKTITELVRNRDKREALSNAAAEKAGKIFSKEALDGIIEKALK